MAQVKDELRTFLQNDGQQSRAFPPMAKNERKVMHQVSSALGLKSKSAGSGKGRFTVIYKSSQRVEYSEALLSKVMYASNKGFLVNSSSKGKKAGRQAGKAAAKGPRGGGGGGGFNGGAAGLRNGEVVGAGASALGRENFGHQLMVKMGWTAGTGLGREHDGTVMPVEQVMRSGRAGLG
ncbi:hypothetical protein BAUCODRAFT_63204 [Baudoinia panamericana UAMH 10762]|uniref:G-patch domain-containing protein n=1 Tax=Baudoinia panamericana (strain UAMH 10762) TaxID=717646 RepID=M2NJP8_BAUPA|nr:uncharacterized protein BAUCODRAFT_63204 [Baudoinia panamericana UAMH 10762]EMC99639.1 hypothetical protein BAUCODRAFT_63204 [Baudoinia panamericana UAMH 10762]